MDVISTIEFQFESNIPQVIVLELDVTTTKLSKIRTGLIAKSRPEASLSPTDWIFKVDGVEVGFIEANNKYGHMGMRVYLERRRKVVLSKPTSSTSSTDGVSKKRDREREKEKLEEENQKKVLETEGIPYDATRHLTRILRQNDLIFRQEKKDNGVLHQWIFEIMGHLSVKIPRVSLPYGLKSNRLLFKTNPHGIENNLDLILKTKEHDSKEYDSKEDRVIICPYLTVRHVSMMCYDQRRDRLLHFDSSSTLIPINEELFKNKGRFKSVSYTFINYQAYDEHNFIVNLAGGNCGMFSGLNAIQCLLKYSPEPVSFVSFWKRFLKVLDLTESKSRGRIVVELTRRIQYAMNQNETEDFCKNVMHMDPCPIQMLSLFPGAIRMQSPKWFDTCDFTCDYLILGYFLDANIGFEKVSKLGNAFRFLLQDIVEEGFVASSILNIRGAMNRLCSACEIAEARFECVCLGAKYCGKECQEMDWSQHQKKNH